MVAACGGASESVSTDDEARAADQPANPDIVVILVDDLGFSDIGAYGSEIATPNIDALAENGLRFVDFHNTAKCFPSRAALLTGLYAQQVNRGSKARTPMIGGVTIAESLKAAGYATFMVGKHHSIENPITRGFDRYYGLRDGAANFFNPGVAARPGEPEPARKVKDGRWWCFDADCRQGYAPPQADFYATDAFTDWAIDYLTSAEDAPYFLYLAYTAPHDPLHAPEENVRKFEGKYDDGYQAIADARDERQRAMGLIDQRYPRPDAQWRDWRALSDAERDDQTRRMEVYAGMIDRLDENIGRLIDAIKARGRFDNTLILFLSDNGASAELVRARPQAADEIGAEHPIGSVGRWASLGPDWAGVANTPFRFYKNYSYNGGTTTPMIAHWPAGVANAGRIVETPAHLIDLHPTLLGVIGRDFDPTLGPDGAAPMLEGVDLSVELRGEGAADRAGFIFNRWNNGRSVRGGRWKLVSHIDEGGAEAGAWALYDMSVDRTETRNVAAAHPDIVNEMAAAYDAWRARVSD
jgi:arylsulfatase